MRSTRSTTLSTTIDTKQNRVAGVCAPGNYVRSVNADGTVTCGANSPGFTQDNPALSCADARNKGLTRSGTTWVILPGTTTPAELYCDQTTNGGGWAMLYNSVLGINTLEFWNIPYADRLSRRGHPDVGANFYDGSVYVVFNVPGGAELMDVIEDIRGKAAVGVVAKITNFNPVRMLLTGTLVSGDLGIFNTHVIGGWSAPDYDGDQLATGNCATNYANVTQHYSTCWNYNLGADADLPFEDGSTGPHVYGATLVALGLSFAADGNYNRVHRISRFVRW